MNPDDLPPVLKDEIAQLKAWSFEQSNKVDISNSYDEPLYHYTTASGLKGILDSKKLWFTDAFHLNDPTEIEYGMKLAVEAFKNVSIKYNNSVISRFCSGNIPFFENGHASYFRYFIASFSTDRDDLGQWRAYSDNGKGFSLGLSPEYFGYTDGVPIEANRKILVSKICYDEQEARRKQEDVINRAISSINRAGCRTACEGNENIKNNFLKEISIAIADRIIWNALSCKHEAYKAEHEIRLMMVIPVHKVQPFLKTRIRGSSIVPYVEFFLDDLYEKGKIAEIVTGPAADKMSRDALENLLQGHKICFEQLIKPSKIPYRIY